MCIRDRVWTTHTGTLRAWNNVFILDKDLGNGLLAVNGGSGHLVYNNTFIVTATGSGQCFHSKGGQSGVTITFQNNAVSGCAQMVSFDSAVTGFTATNNAYANSVGGGLNIWDWPGHVSTSTFATWQSSCACDSTSQANMAGSLGLTAAGIPLTGSMVIGLGTNLSSQATGLLATLQNDTTAGGTHTAVARPGGATAWDSGAFAFAGASVPPGPAPVMFTGLMNGVSGSATVP